jgi:hypothetical protein
VANQSYPRGNVANVATRYTKELLIIKENMNIELLKAIYTIISKAVHPTLSKESIDQVQNEVAKEIQKLSEPEAKETKKNAKA